MLAGVSKHQVLLDGSPQYLECPSAAPRIKAAVSHAKFVVVVRVRFAGSTDAQQCKICVHRLTSATDSLVSSSGNLLYLVPFPP